MDLLLTGIGFSLGVLLPHGLLRWDERRLSPDRLGRSWNAASHWSAVVAFSFLCIPVHFARTRRSGVGLLLGVGWMLLALLVASSVLEGAAYLLEFTPWFERP